MEGRAVDTYLGLVRSYVRRPVPCARGSADGKGLYPVDGCLLPWAKHISCRQAGEPDAWSSEVRIVRIARETEQAGE